MFESLCVCDFRIYAQANDGMAFRCRDKTGMEADAVIVLADAPSSHSGWQSARLKYVPMIL